jgi:hypothetical protein
MIIATFQSSQILNVIVRPAVVIDVLCHGLKSTGNREAAMKRISPEIHLKNRLVVMPATFPV